MPRTICIDFDGVLHSYVQPWTVPEEIPDPPTPGAVDFVKRMQRDDWDVVVCSTRAATVLGAAAIRQWLDANGFPPGMRIEHGKPPAMIYLDDRALRFDGTWPTPGKIIVAATPWNAVQRREAAAS